MTTFLRRLAVTSALAALSAGTPAFAASDAAPQRVIRLASLFGESDEEKAARLAAQQREQAQDAAISSLTDRVADLERTLRQVTGQVEEANHQNVLLKEQIAKMQKDNDYRICQLSAQVLGGAGGGMPIDCSAYGGGPASANPLGASANPLGASAGSNGAPATGLPSSVLGTLPAGPAPHQDVTVDMRSAGGAPPSANTAEFQAAMDLLARGRYGEAGAAFRGFADAHPADPQAAQAVYWMGAVAFVQKDYPGAAHAFAEEIKKYPDAEQAPRSMLRLGQSLLAMKQKQEGCTTLGALNSRYPKAATAVKSEAAKARHEAGCR